MTRISCLAVSLAAATCWTHTSVAFVPPSSGPRVSAGLQSRRNVRGLPALSNYGRIILRSTVEDLEEEIKSMRAGAIKQELESYGISTRTFLEKSELVTALVQARKEGNTPSTTASATTVSATTDSATSDSATASTTSAAASSTGESREALIAKELEVVSAMRIGELKAELDNFGVSTVSFLEKKELAQALAEARADEAMGGGSSEGKKKKKKKRRTAGNDDDEVEEVSAKVEVITDDEGPKTNKSAGEKKQRSQPQGGSPFGGGGMGGMDMGGIGDMLKNMGMGGGAPGGAGGGGNPFAGMGGMGDMGGGGMGDAMKQAQAAMSNPKVMAVVQKAQKNPKVMQAVQECMGNPAAMAKYMSDPEVGPLLKELQEAMM